MGPPVSPRTVARDRFLFRAGRAGYTYPDILEVQTGSVRLLEPSKGAKLRVRVISIIIGLFSTILVGYGLGASVFTPVTAWVSIVVYFAGLFSVLFWWEQRNLSILADHPASVLPLEILGTESFGTFQEIRARAGGTEIRIAIPGHRRRLDAALALAGSPVVAR